MSIKNLKENWNKLGETDPLWAILSKPPKKNNKWEVAEFFETGRKEIDAVIGRVKSSGTDISYKKALDFGCGVGRLTQALAGNFEEVCGVDIAPSMLRLAEGYNKFGAKCKYYLNETNNLRLFPDNEFDFIYTNITLQHMEPKYSKEYIKEFLRVLKPGGLLVFQLLHKGNSGLKSFKAFLKFVSPPIFLRLNRRLRSALFSQPLIEMYGIKQDELIRLIEKNNGTLRDLVQTNPAGEEWISFQYYIAKNKR